MADSSNQEVGGSPPPVCISVKCEPMVQLGRTNLVKDSTQCTNNASDTSIWEVVRSPSPVSISKNNKWVFLPDSTFNSQEDLNLRNALRQIYKDKGELWKDCNGRFRVVYKDDDNIDEYHRCMEHVEIKSDNYSSEYLDKVSRLLEGITIQKDKRYPFTVIRNPKQQELITPSKSGSYREGREYKVTHLYKNPNENSVVKIVEDMITGFTHICKTTIMNEFKCEEVQAMLRLHKVAPEIYVVNRDGEHVNIHMELIKGSRLDTVARYVENKHMWPLCLRIFSEILSTIRILIGNDLSHRDIHSKNIIIEVVENGKFRIRLIDYGDAGVYTITNLINDMTSLVASLIALFTRNDFDAYNEDPDKWIEDNPKTWERYPKLWFIFKGALDVANEEILGQLINFVEVLLVNDRKNPDFNKHLEEIAELLKQ